MNKVVCVYNKESNLTLNKIYEVNQRSLVKSSGQLKASIKIINDKGIEKWYGINRFQNLDKYRSQKISRILKKA